MDWPIRGSICQPLERSRIAYPPDRSERAVEWRITDAVVPAGAAVLGVILIGLWVSGTDSGAFEARVPGLDRPEDAAGADA